MGDPADPASSLLPNGLTLEAFVTLTDYYGYQQLIQIHDPVLIREREHRHVLRFSYRRSRNGDLQSDFSRDNAAALAFAARATSAYPGAFPPAQIREVDALLAAEGRTWPRRDAFLRGNFERYHRAGARGRRFRAAGDRAPRHRARRVANRPRARHRRDRCLARSRQRASGT
jgi:hypothetical protein